MAAGSRCRVARPRAQNPRFSRSPRFAFATTLGSSCSARRLRKELTGHDRRFCIPESTFAAKCVAIHIPDRSFVSEWHPNFILRRRFDGAPPKICIR